MKRERLGYMLAGCIAAALAPTLIAAATIIGILVTPYVMMVALMHAFLLGLPVALLFDRLGWFNAYTAAIGGWLIGALPMPLLFNQPFTFDGLTVGAMIFGPFGAISGVVFWLTVHCLEKAEDKTPVGVGA